MTNARGVRAATIVGRVLFVALLFGGVLFGINLPDQTPEPVPARVSGNSAVAYAFANASPIPVFERPADTGGHSESFEFGRAYEVDEQTSSYKRIKLRNGTMAYVRSADVTMVGSPRWLATTPGYNRPQRELIRFWKSASKLKEFLSGTNTAGSRWDYEEFFDSAPQFQLRLPLIETDTAKLLGGSRQVKVMSVMLPISQQAYRAFESARSNFDKKLDLYFLVDVSGSTKEFLEETMGGFTRALSHNEGLRNRVGSMVVTTFGASRNEKSTFLGKVTSKDLEGFVWHRPGTNQTTIGDREPLIEGLLALNSNIRPDGNKASVLIIISGADVELTSYVAAQSKSIAITNVELKLPPDAAAIFAQITPEPSDDLRNASRQLRNVSPALYFEYSDLLVDDIVANLLKLSENHEARPVAEEALGAVAKAAHAKQMIAFLPREMTSTATLPTRQGYAAEADWYTVRLWLAVDELLWKETAQ